MSTIIRRDPFADFERAFDTLWNRGTATNTANSLPIDLIEQNDALIVRAGLAGLRPEDVEINLDGNVLTIKAEAKAEWQTEDAKVYHREHRYGAFTRSLRLPKNVDLERIEAKVEHGTVTVRVAKREEAKPVSRRIEIGGLAPKPDSTPEAEA